MEERTDVRIICEEKIEKLLNELDLYEPGTKEFEAINNAITVLGRIRNDEFRNEAEQYDKEQKFEEDKKRYKIDKIINIASIVTSAGLTLFGLYGTFRTEEGSVITTKAFPWVQKLIPRIGK